MACKKFHPLRYCKTFLKMSVQQRNCIVRRYNYCENCLAKSHDLRACQSVDTCHKCDSYHHTLLHPTTRKSDLRTSQKINVNNNKMIINKIQRFPTRISSMKRSGHLLNCYVLSQTFKLHYCKGDGMSKITILDTQNYKYNFLRKKNII